MKKWIVTALMIAAVALTTTGVRTQEPRQQPPAGKPVLYLVATAHLDTQWNWTVQDSIRQFIPATFFDNFRLFERFPHYVFTFEGAIHYMWFKEYHPEAWPTLQKYVADGRWRLAGSWINAVDTHVPSPESLMRQALYGKRFFRTQFGRVSQDVYLPDCFGFGFALPATAAASGLKSFSTQKLSWGAPFPPPFAVGRWKGVDGSTLVAELRPGDYVKEIRSDPSTDPAWMGDLVPLGDGRSVGFRYFGVGDQGGAPDAQSVEWVEKAIANPDAKVQVKNTSADQLSRDLTDKEIAALPEYQGELLLKTHGVGCYTSQAAMKTFNRRNELLADAAERASVAAEALAGLAYPRDRLRTAWTRFLWHQFHDDITGTSIPQAYQFSWNDELLSMNEFAGVLTDAVRNVAASLDTRVNAGVGSGLPAYARAPAGSELRRGLAVAAPGSGGGQAGTTRAPSQGIPLVVYNPVAANRREPVEAVVEFPVRAPAGVVVIDHATGQPVASQVLATSGRTARILFMADVPSVGFKVFEVVPAATGRPALASSARSTASSLSITPTTLQNARYTVKVDANGDVSSIFDKEAGTELLKSPIRLQLLKDDSARWPAWEILYDSVAAAPKTMFGVEHNEPTRVVENGPVRVTLETLRIAAGSVLTQRVSLTEGGDRVEIANDLDWKSFGMMLKASFPLTATSRQATYDLGLGTIERGNNEPDRYEVPGQQWADLTDSSGRYGTAILNDSKYGWDKPDDNTLRLTLVRTPLPAKAFVYQSSNDIGHHRFTYAVGGHKGTWRDGEVPRRAMALNQPLVAFQTTPHGGPLGPWISWLTTADSTATFDVRAVKKAEDGDEIVLRLQELVGRPGRATIALGVPIAGAREMTAAEESIRPLGVRDGRVSLDLGRYQSRTIAVTLQPGPRPAMTRESTVVDLPFNLDGFSTDRDRGDGDFDGHGHTVAAELLPPRFEMHGVPFAYGPSASGALNVVVAKGQTIPLPAGDYNRLYVLATAVGGDTPATFAFAGKGAAVQTTTVRVQEWEGAVGQWNSRVVDDRLLRTVYVAPEDNQQSWTLDAINALTVTRFDETTGTVLGLDRIHPGFVKRAEVAWVGTHRHAADGNQPYVPSYVFAYALDVPKGATSVRLPSNDRVRILAMTVARESAAKLTPAKLLYAPELPEPAPTPVPARRPRGLR
jgi:alpha-mannosidase